MKDNDNSLKSHFEFVKNQVEKWPDWKQKALLTRQSNSQKRMYTIHSNQSITVTDK